MLKKDRKRNDYNHSLLSKVLFSYFLIFAVPIILLYASLYGTSRRLAQREGTAQLLSFLTSISNTMDEVFRSVNFVQSQLQGNTAFSNDCFRLTEYDGVRASDYRNYRLRQELGMELYNLYLSNPYLDSLEVYTPYGNTLFGNYAGDTRYISTEPTKGQIESIMENAERAAQTGERSWHVLRPDSKEAMFATYSRPFCAFNPSRHIYSRAVVSAKPLRDHISVYDPAGAIQFYIRIGDSPWIPISGPGTVDTEELEGFAPGEASGWIGFYSGDVPCLMAYFRSRYTGWYYAAAVPQEHYNVSEPLMTEYWFYILGTLAVIFILTALFVSFYLIRPMKRISGKMREAEGGDLSVRIRTGRRDELGYIGHRLNVLLKNIDTLIHTNYETRLLKEGYELKFIQTQLKEHFIYNTLDSIHWIADKNHVPQISRIIFDLSRFFRLTLNNGSDYITIGREAEVLKSYLALLNVRMGETIDSSIEVEAGLENERVIKYFFQPVLENAVVHGLRPKGGGTVRVRFTSPEAGRICYEVRDDGVGISPMDLNDIRICVRENKSDGKYFALMNLNRQLGLYFGEDYTFAIDSSFKGGTVVSIQFPKGCGIYDKSDDH
ncbi:MAG: histidine kinase [Hungatella sp.]|nr:histidine kinase [Hungatella sp.]